MMTNETPKLRSLFNTDFARYSSERLHHKRLAWFAVGLSFAFIVCIALGYQAYFLQSKTAVQEQPKQLTETIELENAIPKEGKTKTVSLPIPQHTKNANIIREKEAAKKTAPKENIKTVVVSSGDNLSSIFNDLKLQPKDLQRLLDTSKSANRLKNLHPEQVLTFNLSPKNELQTLIYKTSPTETIIYDRDEQDIFKASHEFKHFEKATRYASAVIEDSLFMAGKKADLDSKLIMELALIFGWDIDFAYDIRPGDRFSVLYEENYLDGKKFDTGHILAAEFVNNDKTYRAFRFTDQNGNTDYYTEDGKSIRKAFIRTPVNFTRISSRFSLGRKHPILHRIRAHKGVDYAAPRGTPVKAAGEGKISFIGRKGGYGKVIILQHNNRYTTLYGHLNGFAKGLRKGRTVKQGQIIGYVGSTGLATGPHLHYEFHINGKHRDPLKVALPDAKPINKQEKLFFASLRDKMLKQLAMHDRTTLAMKGDK